jgi:gas vesicle protein
MRKPNSTEAKSFAVGALMGATVGAVLALLYAPKAGRELRADLRTKGTRMRAKTAKTMMRMNPRNWKAMPEQKQKKAA